MRYRKLGNTGLTVSEIGFGTIPILQGSVPVLPDYYNLNEEEALAVMEYAYHLGCNLYDTAIVPEYGDAEVKLGRFAARVGREHLIISDKARFFDGNEMYQAVETSCENLGTYADLYFVHQVDAEHEVEVFRKGGALDALTELKAEGKIRFAGVATHYYDILLRGAKDLRVDVLQGSGNLLERGMLDRFREEPLFREKGFLANKVYAAGILPSFFPVRTLIRSVLSYPVSSALVGIGTMEQVSAAMSRDCAVEQEVGTVTGEDRMAERVRDAAKRNCASKRTETVMDPGVVSATDTLPSFETVLSVLEKDYTPIPCDRCQRCVCPYGTEIHTVFRQYQYYFLGKEYWALRKLDMGIEESARHCRECEEMPCLDQCPRKIRIPDEIGRVCKLVRDHL